jgi:PTS system nitrogen regulatory IIA component
LGCLFYLVRESMEIDQILLPDLVIPALKVSCKKQALKELAKKASEIIDRDERDLFDVLIERERLGSTGVGHGVAIPHGRIKGLGKVVMLFARLENSVDFDAVDDQPVDIVCVLFACVTSGAEHLKALAKISRLMRNPSVLEKIRGASSADGIFALLTEQMESRAA